VSWWFHPPALRLAREPFYMRAIWKGAISFGLVNIPISLYPATRREELKFHMLRKSDLSPINYKRVAKADDEEVPWDQIVKGYEVEKGKFIVLQDEDFARVDIEATQTVDISEFVNLDEVDPVYFYKPYYMEPAKGGEKAYVMLREALEQTGKIGIAKVVIKTRQYLAGIKPEKRGLLLELMHFAEELIDADVLNIPKRGVTSNEIHMAKELVEKMSGQWDPEKYHDDYRKKLEEIIEEKLEHPEAKPKPAPKAPKPTKVIDLVSVLRDSLQHAASSARGDGNGHAHTRHRRSRPRRKRAA
jgi:DNA end-binding protein Ku